MCSSDLGDQIPYAIRFVKATNSSDGGGGVTLLRIGESIGADRYRFQFEKNGKTSTYLYGRLARILASGIYNIWEKWYKRKYPTLWRAEVQRLEKEGSILPENERAPVSLGLDSNLVTAFYLLGYGCLGACMSFSFELFPSSFGWILRLAKKYRDKFGPSHVH